MPLYLIEQNRISWDERAKQVIRANGEDEARKIASEDCGLEGPEPWLDPDKSEIEWLDPYGPSEVILSNSKYG